jgi:hypothetical protein
MKARRALGLGTLVGVLIGCQSVEEYTSKAQDQLSSVFVERKQLRLESNKPGTAFCLAGKPLVAGDPGVTVQAGDRVYVVDPAPEQVTTVVAAQQDYFVFVDTASADKVRLQFHFFDRSKCTSSAAGRTCVTSQVSSDLDAFEKLCAQYP